MKNKFPLPPQKEVVDYIMGVATDTKSHPRIIFLDIDGVLNVETSTIEKHLEDKLLQLLENPNVHIVLTSSWRLNIFDETIEYMKTHQARFVDRIISQTVRGYHYIDQNMLFGDNFGTTLRIPRGVEIDMWLKIHGLAYKSCWELAYVIIDDDSDMLLDQSDDFVHVDREVGLSDGDVVRVKEILGL